MSVLLCFRAIFVRMVILGLFGLDWDGKQGQGGFCDDDKGLRYD